MFCEDCGLMAVEPTCGCYTRALEKERDGLKAKLDELDDLFQERMLQSEKYREGLWKLLNQPAFNLDYHQVERVCAAAGIYPEPEQGAIHAD